MIILLLLVRIVVFALGAYLVFRACLSALRTFVLPRSAPDRFNRTTFIVMRQLFELRSKRQQTYLERDRVMELYAPIALVALLVGCFLSTWGISQWTGRLMRSPGMTPSKSAGRPCSR